MLNEDNVTVSTSAHRAGSIPVDFSSLESIEEGCAKLGAYLGLAQPVDRDVFISAVEDPTYTNNLYLSRNDPVFLKHVLDRPTRRWLKQSTPENGAAPTPLEVHEHSNGNLLSRAAKSFVKWTRSGLSNVDDETYRRRLSACAACPHHVQPPEKIVYKVAGLLGKKNESKYICDLCGCFTASKARMEHESCPAAHPTEHGLTRWQEPRAD